jgi:hypothetical protein
VDAMILPLTGTSFYIPDEERPECWRKVSFAKEMAPLNLAKHDSVTDFLYYSRSYWSDAVMEQRTKNRKVWFDTKYSEVKNG